MYTLPLRILAFILGAALVAATLYSAVVTFVLPRPANNWITRLVFRGLRAVFDLLLHKKQNYAARDRILALYAPLGLLALLPAWLTLVILGYTGMYWAAGISDWYLALRASGSALLTLGNYVPEGLLITVLEFSEATLGLMLVALLIAYLPSMYAAFSRRESLVTLLEVRAGSPPSAVEMIERYNRIHGLSGLSQQWQAWETWFAELEESHTSLAALVFFRSPQADHSWVTAAGAVLDAAALTLSAVDTPYDPAAALCIRAGYLALRQISANFRIPYPPDPHYPLHSISVTRDAFDSALDRMAGNGVPLKPDRQQAWSDFAGWRVNYDSVLLALARLTEAPPSPWTGR